jgi:hypothetical protein
MAHYRVVFSGNMVRFETSDSGFEVMKWSPFNRRGKLVTEEAEFATFDAIKAGLRAYAERMKAFALTSGLIQLASEEESEPLNGLKLYVHVAKGQRKPRGWGKVAGYSHKIKYTAEELAPVPVS